MPKVLPKCLATVDRLLLLIVIVRKRNKCYRGEEIAAVAENRAQKTGDGLEDFLLP